MTPSILESIKSFSGLVAKDRGILRIVTGGGARENATIFAACDSNKYILNFGGEYEIMEGDYGDKYLKIKVKIKNVGEGRGCFSAHNFDAFDINGVQLGIADRKDWDEKSIDNNIQLLPGAECEEYIYIPYEIPYVFLSLVVEDEDEGNKYLLLMLESKNENFEKAVDAIQEIM